MQRQRTHVLLVDDEKAFTAVLAKILEQQGFVASTAVSAVEALEMLQLMEPDAIVLDVRMPGLSGVEALPRIRAVCPKAPVILLTGHASMEDTARAVAAGAFDVLHKPCDTATLVARLHEAVAVAQTQSLRIVDVLVPVERCLVAPPSWTVGQALCALGERERESVLVVMDGPQVLGLWDDGALAAMVAHHPLQAVWEMPVCAVTISPVWVDAGAGLAAVAALVARHGRVAVGCENECLGVVGARQIREAAVRWAMRREA